jgi:hypothetical protein
MSEKNTVSQKKVDLEITTFSELYIAGKRPEVGADSEFYSLLIQHPDLFRDVVKFVEETTSLKSSGRIFDFPMDYGVSWKEAVHRTCLDLGRDITEKEMPIQGTGTAELKVELFRFWRNESRERMIQKLQDKGYCPLNFGELLTFKFHYPSVFKTESVLALNQVLNGFCVGIIGSEEPSARIVNTYASLRPFWRIAAKKLPSPEPSR